jgi:predicted nucleic-acid-binding protein
VDSVDTNILVRFLTTDDQGQLHRAQALLEADDVFVAKTVLLETEWVLRSGYAFSARAIEDALRGFIGLPRVVLEDEDAVLQALDWFAAGLDFADALHLASTPATARFATFDRDLLRRARRLADGPELVEP